MSSPKTKSDKKFKPMVRYNWPELKLEFFQGPWVTVAGFRRAKGMPSHRVNKYLSTKMVGWANEKKAWLNQMVQKATDDIAAEQIEDIKKIRARQARLARWMYLKGADKLKDLEPEDVDQARRLIETGMKQEREAVGVTTKKGGGTSLTQINLSLPETQIDKMLEGASYVDVLKFIAEIKRRRIARLGEGTVIEGSGETEPGTVG